MSTAEPDVIAPDRVMEDLLDRRFSCRAFQDRQVDRATIARTLTLAQRSPSWCNVQPWQVIVTEGAATERLRLAASAFAAANPPAPDVAFPERYEGVFQARRRECGWQLYESVGIEKGDRAASAQQAARNFEFFGAPHVAIITTERALGTYGAVDCGVYLGCLLLAAQSMGLSTIPQAALGAVAPAIREMFELPASRQVLFGVSFGYGEPEHPANGFRTRRAALDHVVTWAS
jgi:nitroreductase